MCAKIVVSHGHPYHSHCSCNICQEQGTVAMNFKVVIYIRNHVYLILYTFTLNVCIWSNETICPYQVDIVYIYIAISSD